MKGSIKYSLAWVLVYLPYVLFAQTEADTCVDAYTPTVKEFPVNEQLDTLLDTEFINEIIQQKWDTTGIEGIREGYERRSFDTTKMNVYRNTEVFDYTEASSEESAFMAWLRKLFQVKQEKEEGQKRGNVGNWIRNLFILVACGLLVWFLLSNEIKGLIKKKEINLQEEKPGDLDIRVGRDILLANLEKAIQEGAYRKAIRLHYLIVLKQLNDQNHIEWEDYKLSQDYIKEIEDAEVKREFKLLTKYFNYAWYGSYVVKSRFYKRSLKHIDALTNLLKNDR